jgi:hypothetical protein
MGLSRFAPILCAVMVAACALIAIGHVFTSGVYPGSELDFEWVDIGWLATAVSLMLLAWLILDTRGSAQSWAKAALVLLLASAAVWSWIVWPSFWHSLGADDCAPVDCIGPRDVIARLDVQQGKLVIAIANIAAACCAFTSVRRRAEADIAARG